MQAALDPQTVLAMLAVIDVLRLHRDYWVSREGTERDSAKDDAAISLFVRQVDAALDALPEDVT